MGVQLRFLLSPTKAHVTVTQSEEAGILAKLSFAPSNTANPTGSCSSGQTMLVEVPTCTVALGLSVAQSPQQSMQSAWLGLSECADKPVTSGTADVRRLRPELQQMKLAHWRSGINCAMKCTSSWSQWVRVAHTHQKLSWKTARAGGRQVNALKAARRKCGLLLSIQALSTLQEQKREQAVSFRRFAKELCSLNFSIPARM